MKQQYTNKDLALRIALLFALTSPALAIANSACAQTMSSAEDLAAKKITNFHKFGDGLYRGARPQGTNFMDLKNLGIKTVINLQGGDIKDFYLGWLAGKLEPGENPENILFEKTSFEYLGINFINTPLAAIEPITKAEGEAIGLTLAKMNDPANQPIYIHCEHGKDRTGLVVALYRVFYQNWKKMDAWREMLSFGHLTGIIATSDMDNFFFAATKDKP